MLIAKNLDTPRVDDGRDAWAAYRAAGLIAAAILLALAILTFALPMVLRTRIVDLLALRLAVTQELPLLPIFIAAGFLRPTPQLHSASEPQDTRRALIVTALIFLIVGWLGHYLVFKGYDLSRDEQMAVFDQGIFAHGKVLWPFPSEWRFVADALNRRFTLPIGDREFWVSGYLPVHAGFRALLSEAGIAVLASPLMAALSAFGMWAVARKLWPDSKRTVTLSLILLLTSSQAVITSMTAFSMNMHLALNLVWLALFVADKKRTHALAMLVGLLATGIHQPLFHPLFALPFFGLLAHQRRWRLLASYLAVYAVIGAFWMAYPIWITSHGVYPATPIDCGNANCTGPASFVGRLLAAVTAFDWAHVWMTAANLLRFVCWQHPLLLPLAIFGAITCWRSDTLARAIAVSFVLPVIVMAIILPWQGHGWGYRYLHPVLGNAILLACYGFHRIEKSGLSLKQPLMATTGLAIALLPVHAWMASKMVAPFAHIHQQLSSIPADVVIVDTEPVPFGQDVVFNRYDLSNRPKLLIAKLVKPRALAELCRSSSIAFFDGLRMSPLAQLFATPRPETPTPELQGLREEAKRLNCLVIM